MIKIETDVCIAGAGPAGMTLALLLAKMGVRVLVLEHHQDFHREYRGEVLMPRFTQMFRQINLFDFISTYPHLKLTELEGFYQEKRILAINFKEICPEAPFAIWMPQPILLGALHDKAKTFPTFQILFETRAENLIHDGNRVVGITAVKHGEKIEIFSKVTVGTDGRFSMIRKKARFEIEDEDHQFDLVWFTIPKPANYDDRVRFYFSLHRNCLILPKYPNSLQCGLVVHKDEMKIFMHQGVDSLKQILLKSHPLFHEFANTLKDFSPFNVLQAKIELIKEWAQDGLLLVGDSAHTCSPAGAIGVSVAVGSAIQAADLLLKCLERNDFSKKSLDRLQAIRGEEVRHIQHRQKDFSHLLINDSRWAAILMPYLVPLLGKTRLFRKMQQDLLVMHQPLAIRPDLAF